MPTPTFDGLIPFRDVQERLLDRTGTRNNPVARAASRLRLVRNVVARQPELAVRVGHRLFVLDRADKLDAIAAALGIAALSPAPKPARARRAATSNTEAAVVG